MQNLTGIWTFTQRWQGMPPYSFPAEFTADGKILVGSQFFGTYKVLGSSSYISLAIADFNGQSISSYIGNVAGGNMGGEVLGATPSGSSHNGIWSASLQPADDNQGFHVPS